VSRKGKWDFYSVIDAFSFEAFDDEQFHGDIRFCRRVHCMDCPKQSETGTVHLDCWKFYVANTPPERRLSRMYVEAIARRPWRDSPAFPIVAGCHGPSAIALAAQLQLDGLTRLPREIQDLIAADLGTGLLLRLSAVRALTQSMAKSATGFALKAPISRIQNWYRGERPLLSKEPIKLPALMAIDSTGITSISRPHLSTHTHRTGRQVFITVATSTHCEFQDGTCRLTIPVAKEQHVWNTPSPPNLDDCSELPMPLRTVAVAVDLSLCSGITFFISGGVTRRIHAHTQAMPTAATTFRQITPNCQHAITWVYVPLPYVDDPLAVGVRKKAYRSNRLNSKFTYCVSTWIKSSCSAF
jgi:hypothetical protein